MSDTTVMDPGVDQLDVAYERWLGHTNGGDVNLVMRRLEDQMSTGEPDGSVCASLTEGPIAIAGRGYLEHLGDVASVYRIGGRAVARYFETAAREDTGTNFEGLFRAINLAFEEEVPSLQDKQEPPSANGVEREDVEHPRRTKEELDQINRENLKKANRIRAERSSIKKQIAAMERTIAEIVEDADEAVMGMRVLDALECLPSHGHPKDTCSKATKLAGKILLKANIDPEKTFGKLNKLQLQRLLERLDERGF